MNFRKIIAIGMILLAILIVGAVSASDNVTCDNITVSDENIGIEEVPLDESPLDEPPLEKEVTANEGSGNSDKLGNASDEVSITDFRIYAPESLSIEGLNDMDSLIYVHHIPVDGTLNVWLDGKLMFSKKVVVKEDENDVDVSASGWGLTKNKHYSVIAKYAMANKEIELANYKLYVYEEDDEPIVDVHGVLMYAYADDQLGIVNPPTKYLDGTVTVYVDGKKVYGKKFKASQKIKTLSIKTSDIGKGYEFKSYKVKIIYKTSKKTYSAQKTVKFMPSLDYPLTMSVGENQNILLKARPGASGTLKIYSILDSEKFAPDDKDVIYVKKDKIAEVSISNGVASFSLAKLPKGTYRYIVEYSAGKSTGIEKICIDVKENADGYSAYVTPSQRFEGEKFKVKFTSPKAKFSADVFIDNVFYKSFKVKSGLNKLVISKLKAGKHEVRVIYDWGNVYFSKTFKITVKPTKLILKKVKVINSAKKLKLTATLKIGGKKVKGKQLTFKFKGKAYTAKTNKKGIAKVTIKKSVLQKLKVGEKVKYQVAYGTKLAKRSVKVRR